MSATLNTSPRRGALGSLDSLLDGNTPANAVSVNVLDGFNKAADQLDACLLERHEERKCVLVGLVSGRSVNFVGMHGTAKSDLCRGLAKCIDGAKYFETCFYKETSVDEIFGPFDLKNYEKMEHKIEGFAPDANIIFWDEFWNASSATQNALHPLRNERRIRNGANMIDCPMLFEMAASNLWPVGEGFENSGAAFDRFAIRKEVRRCSPSSWEDLCFGNLKSVNDITPCLTIPDVQQAQLESRQIPWHEDAQDALIKVFNALEEAGIQISERRRVWAVQIAKAATWLDGKTEVAPDHLDILKHVLWADPREQPRTVAKIIGEIANPLGMMVSDLIQEMEETLAKPCFQGKLNLAHPDFRSGLDKVSNAYKKLEGLKNGGNADAKRAVDIYRQKLRKIQTMGLSKNKYD